MSCNSKGEYWLQYSACLFTLHPRMFFLSVCISILLPICKIRSVDEIMCARNGQEQCINGKVYFQSDSSGGSIQLTLWRVFKLTHQEQGIGAELDVCDCLVNLAYIRWRTSDKKSPTFIRRFSLAVLLRRWSPAKVVKNDQTRRYLADSVVDTKNAR